MTPLRLLTRSLICTVVLLVLTGCSPADQPSSTRAGKDTPTFDGKRAFDLLKQQVDLGPRNPGSSGHQRAIEFIRQQLKPHADAVRVQSFETTAEGQKLTLSNIIAHFNPDAKRWVLLAAHWDTRPRADFEIDAAERKQPIPGANDGASGVAVLLELAGMFAQQRPQVGVMMVFFDGEDYGTTEQGMFLGSRHFAANLAESTRVGGKPVKLDYGLLLDMVGDRNLSIYKERNSVEAAPEIVEKVWSAAAKLGHEEFRPTVKYAIADDHIPLIRSGVKCIDIIDFDYGPWHTLDDTPDKCSQRSLEIVGSVVASVVYGER